MRPFLFAALAIALSVPASAALAPGKVAPVFTAAGAVAGKPFTVNLKTALKKGPVVLYFFPSASTGGCNAEANAFAEALPDFTKAGATVIGMTAGKTDQLIQFSSEHCAGKFAVAAASADVIAKYDVKNAKMAGLTTRTSFVIAPNGKILSVHADVGPVDHIRLTLADVRAWRKAHPRG